MLMEMQQTTDFVPVIAIDGPSASGKGTVAQRVAESLGFHYLDSGALYRLVAVAAAQTAGGAGSERSWLRLPVICRLHLLATRFC